MELSYDRELVAALYDEYGDNEWRRHETSPFGRVSFHIHRHYLTEYIHDGSWRSEPVLVVSPSSSRSSEPVS